MGISSQPLSLPLPLEKLGKSPRGVSMKRRIRPRYQSRLEGSRRPGNRIQRRVKALKNLIPIRDSSIGLEGLFRDTADYIVALEMKVRVMQVLVRALSSNSNDEGLSHL